MFLPTYHVADFQARCNNFPAPLRAGWRGLGYALAAWTPRGSAIEHPGVSRINPHSAKEVAMLSRTTFSPNVSFGFFVVLALVGQPLFVLFAANTLAAGEKYKPHHEVNAKNPRVFFDIT